MLHPVYIISIFHSDSSGYLHDLELLYTIFSRHNNFLPWKTVIINVARFSSKIREKERERKSIIERGKRWTIFLFFWREEASFKRDFPKSKRKLLPFFISSYTNNEYFHFVRWLSCQVRVPTKRNKEKMKKKKWRTELRNLSFLVFFLFFSTGISLCKNLSWCKSKKCKMLEIDNKVFLTPHKIQSSN